MCIRVLTKIFDIPLNRKLKSSESSYDDSVSCMAGILKMSTSLTAPHNNIINISMDIWTTDPGIAGYIKGVLL